MTTEQGNGKIEVTQRDDARLRNVTNEHPFQTTEVPLYGSLATPTQSKTNALSFGECTAEHLERQKDEEDISISICRPNELETSHIALWHAFQASGSQFVHPFLSPEFLIVFGKHQPSVRVAVIEQYGKVVGFFPFESRRARVARCLGQGLVDVQGVVHAPNVGIDLQRLLKACGISVLEFDHLIGYQAAQLKENLVLRPAVFVDISKGWDSWLDTKRAQHNKQIRTGMQKGRKLGREIGELRLDPDLRDKSLLHLLMRWKSAQYRRTGRFDRFASPWLCRVVEDCFDRRSDNFSSRLSVLYAGDQVANINLSLLNNGVLCGWFIAYNTQLARYSPGFIAMIEMIRATMDDPEVRRFDLGRGDFPYKRWLTTGDYLVAEGWAQCSSLASLAWRVRTGPRRQVMALVLGNERLRIAARRTLKDVGKIRASIS